MSLYLEFEPHSFYKGFAIRDERQTTAGDPWSAYTDDGNTYRIVSLTAETLKDLKKQIDRYHLDARNGYGERMAKRRLNYLRGEIEAERISYGEIAELMSLAPYIDPSDVELLQWADVPEFNEEEGNQNNAG